jgi:hypothetical protein
LLFLRGRFDAPDLAAVGHTEIFLPGIEMNGPRCLEIVQALLRALDTRAEVRAP